MPLPHGELRDMFLRFMEAVLALNTRLVKLLFAAFPGSGSGWQLRPYDRIMYLLLPVVLQTMAEKDVPWNGVMDSMAQGLEHGMRWVRQRFAHCNKCVSHTNPNPRLNHAQQVYHG